MDRVATALIRLSVWLAAFVMLSPTRVNAPPISTENSRDACRIFRAAALFPPPMAWASRTLDPRRRPTSREISREITGMSLPTAAMASAPTNFPKMSTSVALTSCSQIIVKATGRAKRKSLPASGPFRKLSVMDLHLADEQSSLGIHFIINGAGLRIQAADGLHIGLIQLEIEYIQVLLHSFFMDGFGDDHDAPL